MWAQGALCALSLICSPAVGVLCNDDLVSGCADVGEVDLVRMEDKWAAPSDTIPKSEPHVESRQVDARVAGQRRFVCDVTVNRRPQDGFECSEGAVNNGVTAGELIIGELEILNVRDRVTRKNDPRKISRPPFLKITRLNLLSDLRLIKMPVAKGALLSAVDSHFLRRRAPDISQHKADLRLPSIMDLLIFKRSGGLDSFNRNPRTPLGKKLFALKLESQVRLIQRRELEPVLLVHLAQVTKQENNARGAQERLNGGKYERAKRPSGHVLLGVQIGAGIALVVTGCWLLWYALARMIKREEHVPAAAVCIVGGLFGCICGGINAALGLLGLINP